MTNSMKRKATLTKKATKRAKQRLVEASYEASLSEGWSDLRGTSAAEVNSDNATAGTTKAPEVTGWGPSQTRTEAVTPEQILEGMVEDLTQRLNACSSSGQDLTHARAFLDSLWYVRKALQNAVAAILLLRDGETAALIAFMRKFRASLMMRKREQQANLVKSDAALRKIATLPNGGRMSMPCC